MQAAKESTTTKPKDRPGFKPVTETLKLEKQQLLPKGSSALSSLATEAA